MASPHLSVVIVIVLRVPAIIRGRGPALAARPPQRAVAVAAAVAAEQQRAQPLLLCSSVLVRVVGPLPAAGGQIRLRTRDNSCQVRCESCQASIEVQPMTYCNTM